MFNFDEDFIDGCLPDKEDNRDLVLGDYLTGQKLPMIFDWFDPTIPVKHQRGPYCVGFSGAEMKESQEKIETGRFIEFDGEALYRECKKIDGLDRAGTNIRIVMKILQKDGIKDKEGNNYKIGVYTKVSTIDEMKNALITSGPFIAGIDIYENFKQLSSDFIVPTAEGHRKGGHAILVTGYDDNRELFRVKNSWGAEWGNNGYAWLSYDFSNSYMHTAWSAMDLTNDLVRTYVNAEMISSDLEDIKNGKTDKV